MRLTDAFHGFQKSTYAEKSKPTQNFLQMKGMIINMRKILVGTFAAIVSICVILLVIQTNEKSEIKEKLNRADDIFQSNFSLLCSNLNEQETAETNEENIKHAYVCFSILKLTSFSENEAMNKVIHSLYDLSEKKALYTELNETVKQDLNKLCQNLQDEKLLNIIVEEMN